MSFRHAPSFSHIRTGLIEAARNANTRPVTGRVKRVAGNLIHAIVPGVRVGELCDLYDPDTGKVDQAEVVGFDDAIVVLSPLGMLDGLSTSTEVTRTGRVLDVPVGHELIGRVLDGLGRPLDGASLSGMPRRPLNALAPDALSRQVISKPFATGLRVIDGLITWGEGQRVGVFGPPGAGKSQLFAQILRTADADVRIMAFVGERGREINEFLERHMTPEVKQSTILVVATSDRSAIERVKASYTAMTIAEYFRDQGARVMLAVDSITRLARALREVAIAAGEPPARRGYPQSVLAALPGLLERAGPGEKGSITGLFTVLMEGDGAGDPVAEETRSIIDGHIILSQKLGQAGHFPAVDVGASLSRVMNDIVSREHFDAAKYVRQLHAKYAEVEFLLQVGEYRPGADKLADAAIAKRPAIEAFLKQHFKEQSGFGDTLAALERLTQ